MNPDLRDRAYIYWRMLSTSPEKCAEVVLGKMPNLSCESYNNYENDLVEELLAQISTICSIYHKTPEQMQKLHGISAQQGMFNRASTAKIERGAEAALEDQAQRQAAVQEESHKPKEGKTKKKGAEKESKPKAPRMDDSSDSDGGKGKKLGNEPAKLDADSDSDEDE